MQMIFALMLLALTQILGPSCSSTKSLREYKGDYLESVRLNFEAGEEALGKEDYERAIGYFQFVRSKYPFSKYAALSDLKIADTQFKQEKWLAAASAYEVFLRLHPRHEEAAYAAYRIGLSYFHAVPRDYFLLPKATSKDQSSTKEALAAIDRFLQQYPDSEFVAEAREKQKQLFSYLAQHNDHVARYYERRGRYQAAIDRYLSTDALYPEAMESSYALYAAAELYRTKLHDEEQARFLYERLMNEKPGTEYAKKAEEQLEAMPHEN